MNKKPGQYPFRSLMLILAWILAVECQATKLVVAAYDAPPYAWLDRNQQVRGLIPRQVKELLKRVNSDLEVEYVLASSERCKQLILSGKADLLYSIGDERLATYAVRVAKVKEARLQIWSRLEQPLTTVDQLKRKEVATSQNYRELPVLHGGSVFYVNLTDKLIPMLISGHVDAITALEASLLYNAGKFGYQKEDFYRIDHQHIPVYLWSSKSSPVAGNLQQWINAANQIYSAKIMNLQFEEMLRSVGAQLDRTASR